MYTNCRNQRHLYAENAARFFVWTQHSCFRRFVPGAALEPPSGRSAQFALFAGSVLLLAAGEGRHHHSQRAVTLSGPGLGRQGPDSLAASPGPGQPWPAATRQPRHTATQRARDEWKFWPDTAWRGHDTTRGWPPRPPWPPGWSPGCPLCPPAPRVQLSRAQELRNRNCPCTLGGWPGGPGQAEARGLVAGRGLASSSQQQSLRVRGPR